MKQTCEGLLTIYFTPQEEIAALNLAKFRKAQAELEEAECRVDMAEQQLAKNRARVRGESVARAQQQQ